MATFNEIKTFRLTIYDPAGVRDIIAVSNKSALPAIPKKGAIYYSEDTEYYWKTYVETGVIDSDWFQPDTRLADTKIKLWIDTYGETKSVTYGLNAIIMMLGDELRIVRNSAGADSTEFIGLLDLYNYYKKIMRDYEELTAESSGINTGTMISTKTPEIAGGEL